MLAGCGKDDDKNKGPEGEINSFQSADTDYPIDDACQEFFGNIEVRTADKIDVKFEGPGDAFMVLSVMCPTDGGDRIAEGTYTFDAEDTNAAFTFTGGMYDGGEGDYSFTGGEVKVLTTSDGIYTVTAECELENGNATTLFYRGELPWEDETAGMLNFDGMHYDIYHSSQAPGEMSQECRSIELFLEAIDFEVELTFLSPGDGNTVAAGTYAYSATEAPSCFQGSVTAGEPTYTITGGTITVIVDGDDCTLTFDVTTEDQDKPLTDSTSL